MSDDELREAHDRAFNLLVGACPYCFALDGLLEPHTEDCPIGRSQKAAVQRFRAQIGALLIPPRPGILARLLAWLKERW